MQRATKHRSKGRRKDGAPAQNVLSAAGAPPGTFPVIDPFSKKLFVPMESMVDTRAMHREGVPSLCRIFLQGRCRQGSNCFQAHADTDTILALRAAALAEPSCCPQHGAVSNATGLPQDLILILKNDDEVVVGRLDLSRVCVTNGLHTLVGAQAASASPGVPEATVSVGALCRLHSGGGGVPCCRFGAECNFVHICRDLAREIEQDGSHADLTVATLDAKDRAPGPSEDAGQPLVEVVSVASLPPPSTTAQQHFSPLIRVPMSASVGYAGTPPLNFDPLALAATAPLNGEAPVTYALGMSPVRSFSSTPKGLVWRHNPYGSSKTSSVVET